MDNPLEITEVLGRADAGISSRPFRCRAEDGNLYYVKLGNAPPSSIMGEWIGGHLAQSLGLPVAKFAPVRVSLELYNFLPPEFSELGHGIGFGSLAAPIGSRDLLSTDASEHVDDGLLADLLVFDNWIQNEDRKLGIAGGNPNALFDPNSSNSLLIIDHDSAFDATFDPIRFISDHLARSQSYAWLDKKRRSDWTARAACAAQNLSEIWNSCPEEWIVDRYGDPRLGHDKATVQAILKRPLETPEAFWNTLNPK